jgi:transposase-like protein
LTNQPPVRSNDKLAIKALDRKGECKYCGSDKVVKNGIRKGQQFYRCKDCKHQFFDNGAFPRMRKPKKAVAFALEMYFDGHSLPRIAKNLRKFMGVQVSFQKIHDWIQKFVPQVDSYTSQFEPQLSGIFHADETAIKFRPQTPLTPEQRAEKIRRKGEQYWHFDAIDEKTRFLVGSLVSRDRSVAETIAFFRDCAYNTPRPATIITDDMPAYPKAIRRVYYSHFKARRVEHIHTHGFGARMNNQPIERWHSTLKDRLKPMRGMKSPDTQILKGFAIQYNFLRPHSSLGGATPAKVAQIDLPFEDGWGDLIRWATYWQTIKDGRPKAG